MFPRLSAIEHGTGSLDIREKDLWDAEEEEWEGFEQAYEAEYEDQKEPLEVDCLVADNIDNTQAEGYLGREQDRHRKVLDCTEDDPHAILLLLRIAHLQFKHIPATLDFHTLFEVARLCDYYDCIMLVKPWLSSWLKNEEQESVIRGQEGWLFIAWVFGREDVLLTLAKRVLWTAETNHSAECVLETSNGVKQAFEIPMPLDLVGKACI